MPTSEERKGPTPNGGVRSKITYLRDGVLSEKKDANQATIVEYDGGGKEVGRTYMESKPEGHHGQRDE